MSSVKVLMVAEKPSICNSIAHALAHGNMNTRGGTPPVHEFPGRFLDKQAIFKVTSVVGHVFSCDFPKDYQNWNSTDPRELFQAPIVRKAEKKGIVKLLEREAKGCHYVVLWLDCDREGENICFEVIDCVKSSLVKLTGKQQQQFFRAKFSAVNSEDIKRAMKSLGEPNKNEALSVDARQELDLKVGVAFSRFQTQFFQGRYADLDASVISYGPCQTPTLGFCVKRHIDIASFQPEPYWVVDIQLVKDGRTIPCSWGRGRVFDNNVGHMFLGLCETSGFIRIASIKQKKVKKGRPTPMNTVEMLKTASKSLGIGPYACMQAAERLYLQGYLSYPRTESTAYPESFNIQGTLEQQAHHPHWGEYVRELLHQGMNHAKGGFDAGDHPPITPCRVAQPGELTGDMSRIYELVTRHFIATVSYDAEYMETKVAFQMGCGESFSASGKRMLSPGFLKVTTDVDPEAIVGLPDLVEGEEFQFVDPKSSSSYPTPHAVLRLSEKRTSPPEYLTEAELIGQMEKNGIGTDASIPTHINNILNRNYVTLESGRRLVPTKLGMVLVQGYYRIDRDLVLPKVRSAIEAQCDLIAKGTMDKDVVVQVALENFKAKFVYFSEHIAAMDELFGSSFSTLEDAGRPWTRCGITKRYLTFIEGPPARLYNRFTETVYSLPQGGHYKQMSGKLCDAPECRFELMLYSVGNPARNYLLCPYCYNNPNPAWGETPDDRMAAEDEEEEDHGADDKGKQPVRRIGGRRLCLESPMPDGHPSIAKLTVCDDPESGGVFLLDPVGGPNWRFISTRAPYIVRLPKQKVNKVTVLSKVDEETGGHYITIDFHKDHIPPQCAPGESKYTGCLTKDEFLKSLVEGQEVSNKLKGGNRRKGFKKKFHRKPRGDPRMSFRDF